MIRREIRIILEGIISNRFLWYDDNDSVKRGFYIGNEKIDLCNLLYDLENKKIRITIETLSED
jgi:hypothetical protein